MMFFALFFVLQVTFAPTYVALPAKRAQKQLNQKSLPKVHSIIDAEVDAGFPIPPTSLIASATVLPNDVLDKQIMNVFFPALLSFLITPLTGSVDMFWVGCMKDAAALGGQGAANQIYNSAFWLFSVLPSVVSPLIAQAHGANDHEAVKKRVAEATFIAIIVGILGTCVLAINPAKALSLVLTAEAPTRVYAVPYLFWRGMGVMPAILSIVGFSVLRGTMDVFTPLKVSFIANIVNIILDPILIFGCKLGVVGAAIATVISDICACGLFMGSLVNRGLLKLSLLKTPPKWSEIAPLLAGGFSMQLRLIAMNIAMLVVTKTVQGLDTTGASAAAHAVSLQLYFLGNVASLAMSTVASVLVPMEIGRSKKVNDPQGLLPAKQTADRLLVWGVFLGLLLSSLQFAAMPYAIKLFTPLPNVQELAKGPGTICAILQLLNCVTWTGEGIQQGHQAFLPLAASTAVSTVAMLIWLKYFATNSLTSIWFGFILMIIFRLLGTLLHHFGVGPLSGLKVKQSMKTVTG